MPFAGTLPLGTLPLGMLALGALAFNCFRKIIGPDKLKYLQKFMDLFDLFVFVFSVFNFLIFSFLFLLFLFLLINNLIRLFR